MTSNSNFQKLASNSYPKNTPTVPMSIYRELAGELQATKKQLDDTKQENNELYQQNQSLRREIRKLVQSVQDLEATLNSWEEYSHRNGQNTASNSEQSDEYYHYYLPESSQENWYSHQEENYPVKGEKEQSSQEVSGWFVAAAIVMIVFTFTGIGYMVARPLLNNE